MKPGSSADSPAARSGAGRSLFKRLLDPDSAVDLVQAELGDSLSRRLLSEKSYVDIRDLHGRLIAEYVAAPRSLPWYPRSIVDGCAVRSVDVEGAFEDRPRALVYEGRVKIGEKPLRGVGENACVEVDTGSWVPTGADAVVPVEYVVFEDGRALIQRSVAPGANIAAPASDVAEGDLIVVPGTPWSPKITSALAALGLARVQASRRPRVTVFSTGDELVEPGADAGDALIFDSNRYLLVSVFKSLGWSVSDSGIAPDSVEAVEDVVLRAVENGSDVIVASGGTSAGVEDVLYKAIRKVGRLIFHGLRLKPGKPTLAGVVGGRLVLGLPGNPRSTLNVLEKFGLPLLTRLGLPVWPPLSRRRVSARTVAPLAPERGRDTIIPVAVVPDGRLPAAIPVARESYMIASASWSDGEVLVKAGTHKPIEPASEVDVILEGEYVPPKLVVTADWIDPDIVASISSRYKARPIYYPTSLTSRLLDIIPEAAPVIASATGHANLTYPDIERLTSRPVGIHANKGKCTRIAVPRVYSTLLATPRYAEIADHALPLGVPRVAGALTLLTQGYVDCAIAPANIVNTSRFVELAREEIILIPPRATLEAQRGSEESAGSSRRRGDE